MHILRLLLAAAALAERVQEERAPPRVPGLAPAAGFQAALRGPVARPAPGLRAVQPSPRGPRDVAMFGGAGVAPAAPRLRAAAAPRARDAAMFGGSGGGFLGVGTPELAVIAAVAWAVLGPKELFKLTRQAGAFLGEWQQLGQQARDQFQAALETEIAEDELSGKTDTRVSNALEPITQELRDAVSQFQTPPPTPFAPSPFADAGPAVAPEPLGMGAEAPQLSAEEADAMRQQLEKELGDPVSNAANFQEQISGARNAAVLDEYPADLEAPSEAAPAAPAAPADGLLLSEEDEYDLQIAEAENALENLRAERELLALRRKQMEANARRAAAPEKEQWFD